MFHARRGRQVPAHGLFRLAPRRPHHVPARRVCEQRKVRVVLPRPRLRDPALCLPGVRWHSRPAATGPGAPAPTPPQDTDGDGIPDVSDACPTEPGPASDDPKKNGCPRPKDTDGDGILDVDDACPTEPGPKSDDPKKNGCPPPKDTDGDGIPDNVDKCPNEPETFNGYQDEDGCPDEVPAALKKFTGVVEGINFKTNSADITKASYPVLDKVVQVLTDYPDIRIEISGHTDNVGKADHNKELSQKRADAVKQYFVDKGHQARASDRSRLRRGESHR
jgi:outer membrane protein OmpA-like peptidoglycan-associated protein